MTPDRNDGLVVHLVRHGDTEATADGTLCGSRDVELAPSGRLQAEALAAALSPLRPVALWVSPLSRAQQTAAPIAMATGLTPTLADGLRELAYGEWEGKHETQLAKDDALRFALWSQDPALAAPPGGETAFAVAARSMPVIQQLRSAASTAVEGHVIVVSHKVTIRVLVCALLGLHVGRYRERVACPTASITSVEFGRRGPMLVRLGDTAHLAHAR